MNIHAVDVTCGFDANYCYYIQIPTESGKSANDIEDPEHYR